MKIGIFINLFFNQYNFFLRLFHQLSVLLIYILSRRQFSLVLVEQAGFLIKHFLASFNLFVALKCVVLFFFKNSFYLFLLRQFFIKVILEFAQLSLLLFDFIEIVFSFVLCLFNRFPELLYLLLIVFDFKIFDENLDNLQDHFSVFLLSYTDFNLLLVVRETSKFDLFMSFIFELFWKNSNLFFVLFFFNNKMIVLFFKWTGTRKILKYLSKIALKLH